jgi:hypothetical protein
MAAALQTAVYQALQASAELTALVGSAIFDAAPAGAVPETYVVIGPEEVRDRSDICQAGAAHDFTISVVTETAGFHAAKAIAGAVNDALLEAPLTLSRGSLIGLSFVRARAERTARGGHRRVDLRFRALVEDTE